MNYSFPPERLGRTEGFEPSTSGVTIRRSNRAELRPPQSAIEIPPLCCLVPQILGRVMGLESTSYQIHRLAFYH